jgi:hypothetical protein
MKKAMVAMTMMFALGCFAQTSGGGSSSGSMGAGGSAQTGSSSGSMSSGQSGSMDSGSMNSGSMKHGMKGDKTLKGCIQSQNGGFVLEEKGGKMAMLSGQDLSAHVGHMVKVHGMWEKGSMSSGSSMNSSSSNTGSTDNSGASANQGAMSNSGMGKMDHSGKSFMVENVDMVSDQCKMDKGMSH